MSTDASEEKTEETDGEEDKDGIITCLRAELEDVKCQLKDARLEMETIKLDLWREKDINNALLNERRLQNQVKEGLITNTQESPMVTPAQRSPTNIVRQSTEDSPHFNPSQTPSVGVPPLDLSVDEPAKDSQQSSILNSNLDSEDRCTQSDFQSGNISASKVLAPINPRCAGPANKLGYILKSLQNVPFYRSTLMIGGSNFHYVRQGEIDPTNRSVAIRSISGLCVVSTAHALRQFNYKYPKFKKIIYSLGINDFNHRSDHIREDWETHLSDLFTETQRIFPQAVINFILPFSGLPGVSHSFVQMMDQAIKTANPRVKRHITPSVSGMVKQDGIHLNHRGSEVLRSFLVNTFTKHREEPAAQNLHTSTDVYQSNNIPRRPSNSFDSFSDAVRGNRVTNNSQQPFPSNNMVYPSRDEAYMPNLTPEYPPPPAFDRGANIREMSDAFTAFLLSRMRNRGTVV